jgi:hypothetical protein
MESIPRCIAYRFAPKPTKAIAAAALAKRMANRTRFVRRMARSTCAIA